MVITLQPGRIRCQFAGVSFASVTSSRRRLFQLAESEHCGGPPCLAQDHPTESQLLCKHPEVTVRFTSARVPILRRVFYW